MQRIRAELFRRGEIACWYLRDDQRPVYEFIKSKRFPFFESSRRYGKTTIDLVIVLEFLSQGKNRVWRWCEPYKNQSREIVMPEIDKIQSEVPQHLRFKFHKTDSYYEHPKNGSKLFIRGVNEDRGESSRGTFAHGITADECGSWEEPEYIINEVLLPQLLTTNGFLHTLGTPPRDLGHRWYDEKTRGIKDSRFIQRVITDNKSLTDQQIEEFIEAMGGRNSPACRRELFCEPVSDPESLVVPEYSEEIHDVDNNYERPQFFTPYVGVDLGFNDNTFLVFAYHDFIKNELVIDDEISVVGKNSKEITDKAKEAEVRLWGQIKPYQRVSDNDLQQIYDMWSLCGYQMTPTRKDDKIAAINDMRLSFKGVHHNIRIKKRCESLRFQLKVGMWNERKTDFQRGERTGHLDGIAALTYLHRNVLWNLNPWPQNVGIHFTTHHINKDVKEPVPADLEAMKDIFRNPKLGSPV